MNKNQLESAKNEFEVEIVCNLENIVQSWSKIFDKRNKTSTFRTFQFNRFIFIINTPGKCLFKSWLYSVLFEGILNITSECSSIQLSKKLKALVDSNKQL